MDICVGDMWESPDTGNRWRVLGLTLGHEPGEGRVRVRRMPRAGEGRIPKWEGDGEYVFPPSSFAAMRLLTVA